MKKLHLILGILIFPLFTFAQSITLESFGPTFNYPTNLKNAGDSRMFVSEQEGYIRIIKSDGSSPATPFLNITSIVYDNYQSEWERGLLGFVFHPNYASNGYFYVHYVDQSGDSVISRFTRNAGDPDLADANTEFNIITIPHPYDAHYGGDLAFGSDGYLYITKGDGGHTAGDPENRAQNLNELHGKILRIDIDNPDGGKNYGIPASNPFQNDGDPNTLGEIWLYGFRNPAKFSFDSATGDLWIADVGQDTKEEINLNSGNVGGLNYGWRCYEGTSTFNTSAGCPPMGSLTFPISEYLHFDPDGVFRCAIAGGYRYRGSLYTNLIGKYFAADWCSGELFMLTKNGSSWDKTNIPTSVGNDRWVGFGQDNNNELYVLSNPLGNGQVYKLKQDALSAESINETSLFSITPNPSSQGKVILTFPKNTILNSINTYNLQGQLVRSKASFTNYKTVNLDLSELSTGVYIIEAISNSGQKSQNKLIIR